MTNTFNHNEVAAGIISQYRIITFEDTGEIYYWKQETGLYVPAEILIEQIVQRELGEDCKSHFVLEVKNSIKRQTYMSRDRIGCELDKIPIETGLYDMNTETIEPYTPDHIFLTKHPIKPFEGDAPLEVKGDVFLNEVTESQEFALLLKELAGYCFFRGMPFQNFFILVGKGSIVGLVPKVI